MTATATATVRAKRAAGYCLRMNLPVQGPGLLPEIGQDPEVHLDPGADLGRGAEDPEVPLDPGADPSRGADLLLVVGPDLEADQEVDLDQEDRHAHDLEVILDQRVDLGLEVGVDLETVPDPEAEVPLGMEVDRINIYKKICTILEIC